MANRDGVFCQFRTNTVALCAFGLLPFRLRFSKFVAMIRRSKSASMMRRGGLVSGLVLSSGMALAAGCVGRVGGDEASPIDGDGTTQPQDVTDDVSSSALRRLSVQELRNTYESVVGFVPEAIDRMPPDSLGHSFDRVVNSQTMSPAHLEAFSAMADEASRRLIGNGLLAERVVGCDEADLPTLVEPKTVVVAGAAFGLFPEWAVGVASDPTHGITQYAPDVQAVHTQTFEHPGSYALTFTITASSAASATVSVDGQAVATAATDAGQQMIEAVVEIVEAGGHVIELELATSPDDGSLTVDFETLQIEGPMVQGPQPSLEEVRTCASAVIDELAPRAYRRPLEPTEREAMLARYDEVATDHGAAGALSALLQSILASPHFLFLVELGEPVAGHPGRFALGPHEMASRLSYALCEQPPDTVLRDAAASGQLVTSAQIEAQAQRLLDHACSKDTVERFFEHWLWLNRLPDMAKSPEAFPMFTEAVRDGMIAESRVFLGEMVWTQEQPLAALFDSAYGFPNADTAELYGLTSADGSQTTMPEERRGILTSPSVLAVTGSFDETSPVIRGVYVLEQILCSEIPAPPAELDIIPPPADPNLTTRDRWAAHTNNPACAGCHAQIDPIGFALEDFDGIGRYRTEDNGHPVDAAGGVPVIGVDDGEIVGGAALSEAIASSERLV